MFFETLEFLTGEKKYLVGEAVPLDRNETVVINSARYELTRCVGGEKLENGECEVDASSTGKWRLLLGIAEKGNYTLTVTLEIGKETVKKRVNIVVR